MFCDTIAHRLQVIIPLELLQSGIMHQQLTVHAKCIEQPDIRRTDSVQFFFRQIITRKSLIMSLVNYVLITSSRFN